MRRENESDNPSGRHIRVGEAIRHALVGIFARGRFHQPELYDASITISEARATPDLRHVTVFVMPLGGRDRDDVVAALNREAPLLRGEVTRAVRLKFAPQLHFEPDRSFEVSARIATLLNDPKVARDLGRSAPPKPQPRPSPKRRPPPKRRPRRGPDRG